MAAQLHELWRYRELLFFFVWRDVKVRYKQTVLGVAWAAIQPILTMVVFTLFFGRLAGVSSDGLPYSLFSLAGLVLWGFFANALSQTTNSVTSSRDLLTKVYFPRLAIPVATTLAGLVDLLIAFVILLLVMAWFGVAPHLRSLSAVFFVAMCLLLALGTGLWLAALNALYRDVRFVVPFLIQSWLLATPIAYPSSLLPEPWRTLYGLNPMAGIVEGFRWAMLGTEPPGPMILVSIGVTALLLGTGLWYFRRVERVLADVV